MTICSLKIFILAAGREIFACWQKSIYILNFNFFFFCNCKVVGLGFFFLSLFIEKTEGPCHVTENTRNSICPPKTVEQTGAWQSAQGVPRHPLTGSNLPQLLSSEQHSLPGLVRH